MRVTRRLLVTAVVAACVSGPAASQQGPGCDDHTLSTQGISLYYQTCGQGPPLLLVHGFQQTGSFGWGRFMPSLATRYRLIVPDLRGHGRSTNPSGAFTHRQAAKDLLGLLDALGLQDVKAMGISSGAMTLVHMATAKPSRIEAMVLVGATTYFPEQARILMGASTIESLTPHQYEIQRERHVQGDDQIRSLQRQFNGFKDSYEDMTFTPPSLSTITARTLIIQGDRDPFFPVEIPLQMYRSIPRAFLWIVPNGGHVPINAHAAEFLELAIQFLAGDWSR